MVQEEMEPVGDGAAAGAAGGRFIERPICKQLLAMHSQLLGLCQLDDKMHQHLRDVLVDYTQQYQAVNTTIHHITMNPVQHANPVGGNSVGQHDGAGTGAGAGLVAALSSTPSDLYVLWQEYHIRIGGRRAAQRRFCHLSRGM